MQDDMTQDKKTPATASGSVEVPRAGTERDPAKIEAKLLMLDRLIDWPTSLTSREDLKKVLSDGRQMRIKFGVDITARTLHIGHAVNLRAIRHLQDLGHKVVFMLGGFTTLVGDPTGKVVARVAQDRDEVEENKRAFIDQIKSIIRFDIPDRIEIRDNTEWWGTPEKHGRITVGHLFELLRTITVTNLLSRDMFRERMKKSDPIYASEFLYPVLQGYDSVEMQSDLTIVGTDQMFNEKMAWEFQEANGQKRQAVFCTKITPGLDGRDKQSKSLGNYVGLAFSPQEKFNSTMLLLDGLVSQWFDVYTEADPRQISEWKTEFDADPVAMKKRLAFCIVELFHGREEAEKAESEFDSRKFKKKVPSVIGAKSVNPEDTIRNALMTALGRKAGDIRDAISNNALNLITKVNEDGSYEEEKLDMMKISAIKAKGALIRWGKNGFYRFE